MQVCPFCASSSLFHSAKRNIFFCEDCEKVFKEPAETEGMRLFLSYGHDDNAKVVEEIKKYLSAHGYDVWIDSSNIPVGKDWRERITTGLISSNGVLSFLSKHSVQDPGVCLDELKIAVCLKNAYIKTVLLEDKSEVSVPKSLRHTQWLDMSDWKKVKPADWKSYFEKKMALLTEALKCDDAKKINEELEFISKKLGVSDITIKQQRLLKHMFVGREWLTSTIDTWLNNPGNEPFLVIGVPGSGKSAFAANMSQFNPNVLATIFFEWNHSNFISFDTIIKLLAFKLSAKLPDYREMLCHIIEKTAEDVLKSYHGELLFDWLILNPLNCCIDGGREKGLIIIDGLDETTKEIAASLVYKADRFPNWIKVLFTSRYSDNITKQFEKSNIVNLNGAQEQNYLDIKNYLSYRLNMDCDDKAVCRIADQSEGSFMYATTFCDAVEDGTLSVEDTKAIPAGLFGFYHSLFARLFANQNSYLEVRPFLELLCGRDEVPVETVKECLNLDRYGFCDLRLKLQSLITQSESTCNSGNSYLFKTIKFVHQSIKDWLTDEQSAGEYYIDESNGYRQLARFSEAIRQRNEIKSPLSLLSELKNVKSEETQKTLLDQNELTKYANYGYIKWLILGGEYDKAKTLLLSSFDAESYGKQVDLNNYLAYYDFCALWQWADLFPETYPVDELIDKLTEIVVFPKGYIVSRFAHRSFQISMLILRFVMDSGRYHNAFFHLVRSFPFASFFMSAVSDDCETRDGWDKYYLARDAAICLKKLERKKVPIPAEVKDACETLKLTYNFELGDPMGGMFYRGKDGCWGYGILSAPELFKDVCELDLTDKGRDSDRFKSLLKHYNTTSLCFYLAKSDEEDMAFIRKCISYHADLRLACKKAIEGIKNTNESAGIKIANIKTLTHRLEFIQSLLNSAES